MPHTSGNLRFVQAVPGAALREGTYRYTAVPGSRIEVRAFFMADPFRRYAFLLLLLSGLPPAPAAAQVLLDTTVVLAPVTVTATRSRTTTAAAPVRVTVLDAQAVERTGAGNVAELLSARTGGFVRRYGNGLATLSLRGTGAAHTLLLLDGHRLADPQLGEMDLSLLPTLLLASVEVMHGAGSSLYGTDAMGGVVNLRTHTPGEGGAFRLLGGYGAYGARTGGVMLSGTRGTLSAQVLAEYEAADGDFAYVNEALYPPQTVRRRNADHARRTLYTALRYRTDGHRLRLAAWYNDAEQGLPGLATTPPVGERQWTEHLRLWADDERAFRWGSLRLGGLVQQGALRYLNPQLDLDETGRTLLSMLEAEADVVAGGRWLVTGGVTGGYETAEHPSLADGAAEVRTSAFVHGTGAFGRVHLYPALRADLYLPQAGDVRRALSPRLGLNVRPLPRPDLFVKASVGRAFRTPTFNQRFWQPGGNPALRPEAGWTYDAGLFLERPRHQAEVTAYATFTRDQVVWSPARAGYWYPENLSRTRTLGLEASYQHHWVWPGLRLDGGLFYTFTDARDRSDPGAPPYDQPLRYVPREQLKLHLSAGTGAFGLDLNGRYAGRRYITTDATQYLDPFVVLDAQLRVEHEIGGFRARLALLVENLLDADYAVMQHYPMPPRHARLRLILETLNP